MIIFMWSGPRNLSTALMRSFENRSDTKVIDEPFYAYYLKKTQLDHPMKNEIINNYPTSQKQILKIITEKTKNNEIFYQKHMTHHIIKNTRLDWLNKGHNCFLIRHPAKVINSYIKKNSHPEDFKKLTEIKNIQNLELSKKDYLFHAGTKFENNKWLSNGGRVLNFTHTGDDLTKIRTNIHKLIKQISWEEGYYRKDIGWRYIHE